MDTPRYKIFYRSGFDEWLDIACDTGKDYFNFGEVKEAIETYLMEGGCFNDLAIYELREVDEMHINLELHFHPISD